MKKGMTMVEIMIALAILAIAASILFGAAGATCVGHKDSAQASLVQYGTEMGYEIVSSSCVNKDTDGDGYVSCTAKLKSGEVLNVECVGWQGTSCVKNEGCRTPKLKMPTTGVQSD